MDKDKILKELYCKFLIDKKDKAQLKEPLIEKIKKEIDKKNNLLNTLYIEKILLENEIMTF